MTRICRRCGHQFEAEHGEKLCARCNPVHETFPPVPIDLRVQYR